MTTPTHADQPDLSEAMDHGKLRVVQVFVYRALLDMSVPGRTAGDVAEKVGIDVMKAVKPEPAGERFVAAQAVVHQHLVAAGATGDTLVKADRELTRTVIQALAAADEQARGMVEGLTAAPGTTH